MCEVIVGRVQRHEEGMRRLFVRCEDGERSLIGRCVEDSRRLFGRCEDGERSLMGRY